MLDGCPLDCGKRTLNSAGINNIQHVRITDLGYIKGKTNITPELIEKVYNKVWI